MLTHVLLAAINYHPPETEVIMDNNFQGFLDELKQKADSRAELFQNSFPEYSQLITNQFQLLAEVLIVFRNQISNDLEKSVLIQAYRSFNCCWIAYQNIKSGFLSEGSSVALTAFDSSLFMEYFITKPHLATRWLDGNDYPVQSFYKILPTYKANQKIFLLLKECTDYGLHHTPRQLIEDSSTPSFQLGGNDDIKKQFLLVKLITKVLCNVLNLLREVFDSGSIENFQEKMIFLERSVAAIKEEKTLNIHSL
jgi:hypothetical protein